MSEEEVYSTRLDDTHPVRRPIRPAPPAIECRSVCVCVTFVTFAKCVCVAFVAVAGRCYTYTVCTYLLTYLLRPGQNQRAHRNAASP